jgi:hypothetical protein
MAGGSGACYYVTAMRVALAAAPRVAAVCGEPTAPGKFANWPTTYPAL